MFIRDNFDWLSKHWYYYNLDRPAVYYFSAIGFLLGFSAVILPKLLFWPTVAIFLLAVKSSILSYLLVYSSNDLITTFITFTIVRILWRMWKWYDYRGWRNVVKDEIQKKKEMKQQNFLSKNKFSKDETAFKDNSDTDNSKKK